MLRHGVSAVALALVLSGCALKWPFGKDELNAQALPNLKPPPGWTAKGGVDGIVANGWLASFADPQLDALVREALAYNPDLLVAAGRIEQAAAYAKLAGAKLYPQVN